MANSNKTPFPTPCRVVVKVGTRLLTHSTGKLNLSYMEKLVRELADLCNQGHEVILVSSGSIGAGRGRLNIMHKEVTIPEKQAIAAVGQGLLVQIYEKLFSEYGLVVGQILITRSDLISRKRYINACNTVLTLFKLGVIPIINENDSVSVEELKFGDNDRLSALVAGLSDAHLLVLLTDIDGLYNSNPRKNPDAELIPVVEKIDEKIKASADKSDDDLATGGMVTKLQAAEIATNSGVGMYITDGNDPGVISRLIKGKHEGTYFQPLEHYLNRRKRWIAYGQIIKGRVTVDRGACNALCSSYKSLLPVGVVSVEGNFEAGDLIAVNDPEGNEIGRGLSNFSSEELSQIMQRTTPEVANFIDRPFAEEVIHRDNMIVY
ncbi:MAG: glutamate 5-kinase [Bacillota bacterium]